MAIGKNLFMLYAFIVCLMCWVQTPSMMKKYISQYEAANGKSGKPNGANELKALEVYFQVIGTMIFAQACLLCPGAQGLFALACTMIATMTYHIFIEGLTPPVPIMLMGLINFFLAYLATKGGNLNYSKYFTAFYFASTAAVFTFDPETPLNDTFPNLEKDTTAYKVVLLVMTSVAYQSAGTAIYALTRPDIKAFSLYLLSGFGYMYYRHVTYGMTPPLVGFMLYTLTALGFAYDAFVAPAMAAKATAKSK